jgi:hypothetical protein
MYSQLSRYFSILSNTSYSSELSGLFLELIINGGQANLSKWLHLRTDAGAHKSVQLVTTLVNKNILSWREGRMHAGSGQHVTWSNGMVATVATRWFNEQA